MARKIRVGLDFDGVVAYNPFRVIRKPISVFKREVLGVTRLKFFVPRSWWQRFFWIIVHESSIFPAPGFSEMLKMAESQNYEFHLITARFGFLRPNLDAWLKRHKVERAFKTINVNEHEEQPHMFKLRMVNKLKLDYFVEDNLDIVRHLDGKTKTEVCWIYNVIDKIFYSRSRQFPYLKAALEWIREQV